MVLSLIRNQPSFGQIKSDRNLMIWNGGSILVALIPLISFFVARHGVANAANNGNNNNNKNKENDGGWFSSWFGNGDENGGNNKNNNQDVVRDGAWWWPGSWGADAGGPEGPPVGITCAYMWTLLLFGCLILYGNQAWTRRNGASKDTLNKGLMAYVNMAALCIVLTSHAVNNDEANIEETGWYGQQPVLFVLTCLLEILFCAYFMFKLRGSTSSSSDGRGNRYYGGQNGSPSSDADAMGYRRESDVVELGNVPPSRSSSQPKQDVV